MKTSLIPALPADTSIFVVSSDSNDTDAVASLHAVDDVEILTATICQLGGHTSANLEEIRREVALQLQHTADSLARECATAIRIEASGVQSRRVRPTGRRSDSPDAPRGRHGPARRGLAPKNAGH